MRHIVKAILNALCRILVLPLVIPVKLEQWLISRDAEFAFNTCTQIVAMLPGIPGAFLRRAFYMQTLDECSGHCHIGFGTVFSHRSAVVKNHVYIGNYALIGSANLGEHALIGSRASILSGRALHMLDQDGMWSPYSADRLVTVDIGRNAWIGEGAIIVADIGEGCMIGAGSVVTANTKPHVVMSGNPARFIKSLVAEA